MRANINQPLKAKHFFETAFTRLNLDLFWLITLERIENLNYTNNNMK